MEKTRQYPALGAALAGAVLALAGQAAAGDLPPLPSGRTLSFVDVITDVPSNAGSAWRFRFLDPELSESPAAVPYASLEADMQYLCDHYALPKIDGKMPDQIVISISDREVEFGLPAPEAKQVFETYRPENGHCVWDPY